MKTLGESLKCARENRSLTLRQVEETIGVSNAYLSQLENGKIKKPSANVLYKLANLYQVEMTVFLYAAGIIKDDPIKNSLLNSVALRAENISNEEEQKLLEYLKFLRYRKHKP